MPSPVPAAAPSPAPAAGELRLCGLAAVRARFQRDPGSFQRLYFDAATGRKIGVLCRVLAQAKRIYRQVGGDELERIAGSVHHGGIVAVVSPPVVRPVSPDVVAGWAREGARVLLLEGIGNAHNLGAIVRTAAFLGVPHLVLAGEAAAAQPTDAAHRVAEGGFEHVTLWRTTDLPALITQFRAAGGEVIGATTRGGAPRPGARSTGRAPRAVVLGNEEHGLSAATAAACSRRVTLPGSGLVESLNVSVAAALMIWEYLRDNR
jgi:TrmH RNA methyltransferase